MEGLEAILLLALAGGILALDRTAFLQAMISRPIVTGPIIGFLLGDIKAGVTCGLLIEPIWLARLPVGGSVPPDDTVATIASVSAAVVFAQSDMWPGYALFAIPVGLPFAWLGRWVDIRIRKANDERYRFLRGELADGRVPRLTTAHMGGAMRYFFTGAILALVAHFCAGFFAQMIFKAFPGFITGTGTAILFIFLPIVGAGALLTGLSGKEGRMGFGIGVIGSILLVIAGGMP